MTARQFKLEGLQPFEAVAVEDRLWNGWAVVTVSVETYSRLCREAGLHDDEDLGCEVHLADGTVSLEGLCVSEVQS